MPTRVLHGSLTSSPSLASCSPRAQDAFPRFILAADDFGCFDANPRVLLGRSWPLRSDVSEADISGWLDEYVTAGMAQLWEEGGRSYCFLTGWDGPHGQRHREEYDPKINRKGSKRHTPAPPTRALQISRELPASFPRGNSAVSRELPASFPLPQSQSQERNTHSRARDEGLDQGPGPREPPRLVHGPSPIETRWAAEYARATGKPCGALDLRRREALCALGARLGEAEACLRVERFHADPGSVGWRDVLVFAKQADRFAEDPATRERVPPRRSRREPRRIPASETQEQLSARVAMDVEVQARWAPILAVLSDAELDELEADKAKERQRADANGGWHTDIARRLDAAEQQLYAKWSIRMSLRVTPVAAGPPRSLATIGGAP